MSAIVKKLLRANEAEPNPLDFLDKEDLIKLVKSLLSGGVALSFSGKRSALEIGRKVRPRVMRRESKLHVGPPDQQGRNLLIEGENLQAMVTLYKFRGQIDLIVTDPPYNTGQQFRYNDAWDKDPNDPELGTLVAKDDGSRHTKWIKAMMPRLQVMKSMLKPNGVIAICIDENELYHLGMLMDEVFGEDNRLGIINWQKAYSPKNDSKTISKTTEYVLAYAKDRASSRMALLDIDRTNLRSLDGDETRWFPKDPTARQHRAKSAYAIQSPFTGFAASATTRVPQALSSTIERLRRDKHWTDGDLVTKLRSSDVVSSGLVKKNIMLGGYLTPMELAIDDMLAEKKQATEAAHDLGLSFRPKAIYVATTNVPEGGTMREDAARPFTERQARPIQIWRHLVENAKIDPAKIAVYCDLRFDSKFPPPRGFNLFAGGDNDYDAFIAGGYEHIIFNLGLQEGWDEPECGFAYIDKDMGSPDQVTQIVGRVLRQPGAQHYSATSLNTAHFYIRTDERGVFEAILEDVERKLAADSPEITLTVRRTTKGGSRTYAEATKQRQVPTVSIDSSEARLPVGRIVDRIVDFRQGGPSTIGKGGRIQVLQTIGEGTTQTEEWVEVEHSNRVTARWILRREIQQLFPAHGDRTLSPINICDIEHPKFDALVEYNSAAANHLREQARSIVKTYIERSKLVQNALDHPYIVGDVPVDEAKLALFKNAVHRGYSGLNNDERPFAEALDKTKRIWCRNPSQGGFSIPLLDHGNTRTFSPDFLVWLDKVVFALDTKGDHLITEDAGRKLFDIEPMEDGLLLVIRLITKGEWTIAPTGEFSKKSGSMGHTVWRLRNGRIQPTHTESIGQAIEACLQK